ncbi:MAG: gliding motility-associated ABC transporter ATP-binding subunit GldA [Bacteroidota bacterium]|jgi:ABC-2 type transport system ATP-binding protein
MSIKVQNITKIYGNQKALNNVSFEVNAGEIVGFLGPNGAGKSTMMKILTCYLPQTSGQAIVCGFDVEKESMKVKKNVGYLPEHNPLYLEMYVKEYLSFIGGLHGIKNVSDRVKEMISITGLELEQRKKIGALSKGFRQRVGLAQALIHDPKVLIMDEPTTGLDPNQLDEIRALIKNVGKEKTVLLSTHIMQEVEAVCDRVIIINLGEVKADGDIGSLKSETEQVFLTVEFDTKFSFEKIKEISGVINASSNDGKLWQITSNGDIRKAVFKFAVDQDTTVLQLNVNGQKMEDIFRIKTKK